VLIRIAAVAALSVVVLAAQVSSAPDAPVLPPQTQSAIPELQPDQNDPMVVRAKLDFDRVKQMVNQGALPRLRLEKAQDDVDDALDMSILKKNIYSNDTTPEQADQMVQIAERMVLRRQRAIARMQALVTSGVISLAEAQLAGADLDRSRTELAMAITRASVVRQLADAAKIQKQIATLENQAETHPEWNGRLYTRYDGNGAFSAVDRQRVEGAFMAHFFKPLPISADGETAVHRSLGFNHRGRIDVGVSPDSPEGVWLLSYLQKNHIPYFAFRAAMAHRATGAHIHIGPQSTRLSAAAD
jgi:multidrug resistance efflux pump